MPQFSKPPSRSGHPSRRVALGGLLALPLGGCLGRTSNFLGEADTGDNTLHVVTTRRRSASADRPPFFEAARSPTLKYARAQLNLPDGSALGHLGALVKGDYSVRQVEVQPGDASQGLAEALRGRDSLLFVHGYNQTFESAATDAFMLSRGINFRGNTAVFSWPSKGGLLDYGYDRESALLARDHLADALTAVLNDPGAGRLHIVAHSMGTLVTLEALRSYRDRNGDKGLDHVGAFILASPDIDLDVFKANIGRLGPLRDKLLVITATNDRALEISRRISGGDRVGALPAAAFEGLGIKVIDATEFASGLVRHDAFLANADVRGVVKRAVERS